MLIVEHTGVPQRTIEETVQRSKAFFDLPVDRKERWGSGGERRGSDDRLAKLPYPGRTWVRAMLCCLLQRLLNFAHACAASRVYSAIIWTWMGSNTS